MELIKYLPLYLQDIRELKHLMKTEESELDLVESYQAIVLDGFFIVTANEGLISKYEKIYGLTENASLNIEDRRFRLLSYIASDRPYTLKKLQHILNTLCGEGLEADIDCDRYSLDIKVALTSRNQMKEVKKILGKIVPANMVTSVSLKYNRYEMLRTKKHNDLRSYTQTELREGVIA